MASTMAMNTSALALLFLFSTSAPQQIAPVQVLKISAGPAGFEKNGVFELSEERSVFSRSTDREVIVLFRWEHVPGPHKLVAQWRSPDGGASVSSAIDYDATDKRFGAYWRLPLAPAMSLGVWSIDVTIDGRPAGRFTFEVTDAKVEAPSPKRPLTESEIYQRLASVFIVLRRGSADGRELDAAAAFMAAPKTGRIYTVMPALDSSDRLRAVMSDRITRDLSRLVAWNRREQWAVLEGTLAAGEALPVRSDQAIKIGSRCFSMEGTADGARVLITGTITGEAGTVAGRPVSIATFPNAFGMPGAPVVDEYGELFGIVGAGMPGDPRPVEHILEARDDLKGAPIVPFGVIAVQAATTPVDLAALRAAGRIMPSVVGGQTASGGFTRGAVKRADSGSTEFVVEFSKGEKAIGVVLSWTPRDRLRGQAVLRVFDAENTLVAASQPRKVSYNSGSYTRSSWEVPMLREPGTYRVDVLIDANTYWRGFLRINP